MKKILLVLTLILGTLVSNGQEYVSRKQHINTINNQYVLGQSNIYFTIKDGKILNTDRKGIDVYEEYVIGEVKKGDVIVKCNLNSISEGTTGKIELVVRRLDTFTNKSSKITYELNSTH